MRKKIGFYLGAFVLLGGIAINGAIHHSTGADDVEAMTIDDEQADEQMLETSQKEAAEKEPEDKASPAVEESAAEEPTVPQIETITLVSVGDIMMHSDEIKSGYNAKTGAYDYSGMFEEIKPFLEAGDMTIGNLEFVMAGAKESYTGYPMFNAPSEMADAIKDAGIDILTTANNHSLDRHFKGIEHTIDVLDHRGILHTGTYKTKEGSSKILMTNIKGINMAFLAYTYGTNGIKPDKGKEFAVNYINKDKIKADIQAARKKGAELVCVSMHFGVEYKNQPVEMQKELADFLAQNGADVILGGHPHVLEPMEVRKVTLGGRTKDVVILYSQGNFISGQRGRYMDTGAVFNMTFHKNLETGNIALDKVSYIPTWVDTTNAQGRTKFRVLASRRSLLMYEEGKDKDLSAADHEKLRRSLADARAVLKCESGKVSEKLTYAD